MISKIFRLMKRGNETMTNAKFHKEVLKDYKHALVTKEDIHPMWTHGMTQKLTDYLEVVKKYDIPFCMNCHKFGGDLIGRCSALTKEPEQPKIEPIKMGFMVDTDEAQHWVDAERFDYTNEHYRLFKGIKMVACFSMKEVNYVKQAQQPGIIIRGNTVHGNHI